MYKSCRLEKIETMNYLSSYLQFKCLNVRISDLVHDVQNGDILIDLGDILVVRQDIKDVCDCGRHPTSALVEELIETLRTSWNEKNILLGLQELIPLAC